MDNNVSQGVRIIVERCETNPDEMMEEYGKWSNLRNALFDYMENRNPDRQGWLRGLREDEINALYEAFGSLYRKTFDEYVMKNVLVDEEEDDTLAAHKMMHSVAANKLLINNPQMLQNSIHPGSWQNVATQTSNTSIISRLRKELGIK